MGSFSKLGSLLIRVPFYKGAVLYWGVQKGTLIQRTSQIPKSEPRTLQPECPNPKPLNLISNQPCQGADSSQGGFDVMAEPLPGDTADEASVWEVPREPNHPLSKEYGLKL